MHIIEFTPPMQGFEGSFNTFRLGLKYSRILTVDEKVALINKREFKIFAVAKVTGLHTGALIEMATQHARYNHNQIDNPPSEAAQALIASMTKRYGPHKINESSGVTVIYLKRLV